MDSQAHPKFTEYLISKTGEIFSLQTQKLLMPQSVTGGYLYVQLRLNGQKKYKGVHCLVAETWLPNPNGFVEVNHIDLDKSNNQLSNLEWCTHQYNMRHARGKRVMGAKLTENDVETIHSMIASGTPVREIASMFNVSKVTIHNIKSGRTWCV